MHRLYLGTILFGIVAAGVTGCATHQAGTAGKTLSRVGDARPSPSESFFAWFRPPVPNKAAPPEEEAKSKQEKAAADARAALSMAMLSERRGQTQQARHFYEELSRRDPNNPIPYWRLGVIAGRSGKIQEAEKYLAKAASLSPNDPELLCDLGYLYYLDHRLDESEKVLRTALNASPDHVRACNNLALVLGDQGKDEACFEMFRKADGPARAYANMGYLYSQRGDLNMARAAYTRALSLDSSLEPAIEAMAQLRSADRDHRAGGVVPAQFEGGLSSDSPIQAIWERPVGSSPARTGSAPARGSQPTELGAAVPAGSRPAPQDSARVPAERPSLGATAPTARLDVLPQRGLDAAPRAPMPGAITWTPTQINQQQHRKLMEAAGFGRPPVAAPLGQNSGKDAGAAPSNW